MNAAEHTREEPNIPLRIGYSALALLSAVALLITGYAYLTLDDLRGDMSTTESLTDLPGPPKDDGAVDILLVGTDARTDAQGNQLSLRVLRELRTEAKAGINTDTLIILRMPRDGSHPTAVSIPRDTWVKVPSGGHNKINSAFNTAKVARFGELYAEGDLERAEMELESDQAGRLALVKTVQDFTQLRIDHYAEVSLLGFYLLTEALGGVEVCLNNPTRDKDAGADFEAGRQRVSGGDALSFVRQRKNLPRGDLDRIVRQQVFLASALDQVLSSRTLTSPGKLADLTDAIKKSVVLDPDLDILEFAANAKSITSGDVEFVTIPVVNIDGRSPDGRQSIVEVDAHKVREFVADLAGRGTTAASKGSGGGGSGAGAPVARGPLSGAPLASGPLSRDDKPITGDNVPCVN